MIDTALDGIQKELKATLERKSKSKYFVQHSVNVNSHLLIKIVE